MSRKENRNYNLLNNCEQIAFKSDEELKKMFIQLRSKIYKMKRKKSNTRDLEIEFCYLQKEMQDRKATRKIKIK